MKKLWIGLIVVFILFAGSYFALIAFINKKGKDLLSSKIEQETGLATNINSLSFKFPYNVSINQASCGGFILNKIDIVLGAINPFKPSITLNKVFIDGFLYKIEIGGPESLREPEHNEKEPVKTESFPSSPGIKEPDENSDKSGVAGLADLQKPEDVFSLRIRHLKLSNGVIEITDKTQGKILAYSLKDLKGEVKEFSYPDFGRFFLQFQSSLSAHNLVIEDALSGGGWINYPKKDMDVKVNLQNIGSRLIKEYLPQNWQPDKLGIEEAYLSLLLKLNSKNNDLAVEGQVTLEEIKFVEQAEDPSKVRLVKTVLSLLKRDKDKSALEFQFNTKMDNPVFDFSVLKASFSQNASFGIDKIVIHTADKAIQSVVDKVKDTKELTVDNVVDAIKETGKDFGKEFKDIKNIFKSKKE
ncbi:MAG: DUF748 domain-containing protein [Candidatus Omnitrophota bacterium]